MASGKNFARLPVDVAAGTPSDGAFARSVAIAVADEDATPAETQLVTRALREAATFAGDATPVRHLLSSCHCTRGALAPALLEASKNGNVDGVRLLLNARADPRAQPEGKSALHVACEAGDEAVARLLVEADGAAVYAGSVTLRGQTPLDVCRANDLGGLARRLEALSGAAYDGGYADGLRDGVGTLTDASGASLYDGEWRTGKMSGNGTLRTSGGLHGAATYTGTFSDGKLCGQGRMECLLDDGEITSYQGGWLDGKRQGEGTYRAGAADEMSGAGGTAYVGQWRADKRHGRGTLSAANGKVVYRGVWRDDRPAGWNLYRARLVLGWSIARIMYPMVGAAVLVCALSVVVAVLTATPAV